MQTSGNRRGKPERRVRRSVSPQVKVKKYIISILLSGQAQVMVLFLGRRVAHRRRGLGGGGGVLNGGVVVTQGGGGVWQGAGRMRGESAGRGEGAGAGSECMYVRGASESDLILGAFYRTIQMALPIVDGVCSSLAVAGGGWQGQGRGRECPPLPNDILRLIVRRHRALGARCFLEFRKLPWMAGCGGRVRREGGGGAVMGGLRRRA